MFSLAMVQIAVAIFEDHERKTIVRSECYRFTSAETKPEVYLRHRYFFFSRSFIPSKERDFFLYVN